jgi:biofilm PGA synthesis protein PgaD
MTPLVIDRPELQTVAQRYGFGSVTLMLWLAYLYLWLPIISVIAWLLGARLFYHHIIERGGLGMLASDLQRYGLIIVAMVSVFLGWALINLYRFRNSRRNTRIVAVTTEMLARHYHIDEADVQRMQASQVTEISHDEDGNIVATRPVAVRSRAKPAPAIRLWPRRGPRGGAYTGAPTRGGGAGHSRRRSHAMH